MRSSREILMNCKKVQFSGEIQTWETGIDKGPKKFNLNFCAKNNIIFLICLNFPAKNTILFLGFLIEINVARFARINEKIKNECSII